MRVYYKLEHKYVVVELIGMLDGYAQIIHNGQELSVPKERITPLANCHLSGWVNGSGRGRKKSDNQKQPSA